MTQFLAQGLALEHQTYSILHNLYNLTSEGQVIILADNGFNFTKCLRCLIVAKSLSICVFKIGHGKCNLPLKTQIKTVTNNKINKNTDIKV